MSASVTIQSIGYAGAALGVVMVLPQIRRTYRDRTLGGVSALAWSLNALSSFTWLLYGITADEPPQIPGNVLTVAGSVVIALAVPAALARSRRGAVLLGTALALVAIAVLVPPTAVGFVAFGIGIVSTVPQTLRSLRRPPELRSAVSVPTWLLFGTAQLCWLVYAVLDHDPVVLSSAVFLVLNASVIVTNERRRGRPAPVEALPAMAAPAPDPC